MFSIAELPLAAGRIGICPLPGRTGDYAGDLARMRAWRPDVVLTLVSEIELEVGGAETLETDLQHAGIAWWHLPINDFRPPCNGSAALWTAFSAEARDVLAQGGRVLAHCYGGCGRAGMVLMRLMVEAGEAPEAALARLRRAQPCAVETAAQAAWAAAGVPAAPRGAPGAETAAGSGGAPAVGAAAR